MIIKMTKNNNNSHNGRISNNRNSNSNNDVSYIEQHGEEKKLDLIKKLVK